jgi:hypothetical protein
VIERRSDGKKVFACTEVNLSHAQMLQLKNAGMLSLSIHNDLAAHIVQLRWLAPSKSTASAAFPVWSWVAGRVKKKGDSDKVLEAGLADEKFYERVRKIGGWVYHIEASEADKFKTHSP